MSRQIEFRGYDIESKCWRYGYYFCKEDITLCAMYDNEEHWQQDKEKNKHHLIIWNGFSDWNMPKPHYQSEVDGKSIGQFTGLYDKNKKKIYEGDILKASDRLVQIQWNEYICSYDTEFIKYIDTPDYKFKGIKPINWRDYEVIGNVYENKELLEEEKC